MSVNKDIETTISGITAPRVGVERIVGLRTPMDNSDTTDMFMQFLGFSKISIGHFGTEDETQWQKDNEEWLEKMCMYSVGDYFVRIETCDYHEVCDVRVWRSWMWIMRVMTKLQSIGKMPTIEPDKKKMYKMCGDIVREL